MKKPSMDLTDKQSAVLMYMEANKKMVYPPVRQAAKYFGVYPATIQDHIAALRRKGYLK